MRLRTVLRVAPALLILASIPAAAAPSTSLLRQLARAACAQTGGSSCAASAITRRALPGGVAEYSLTLKVGPGAHDVIGLHRVVKETAPNQPARTTAGVFFAHGDLWPFDGAFLAAAASPAAPDDRALPVFLAKNGLDVWGIDFRWTQVPAATTDFTFMKDWGLPTDLRDLGIGLAVARLARSFSGGNLDPLFLLGWSRGGITGYAYLNAETRLPPFLRQVKGAIIADVYAKTTDATLTQAACGRLATRRQQLAAGTYADNSGGLFVTLGSLAKTAPAGASPVVPGATNRIAALLLGGATYTFLNGQEFAPLYHFTAATFDAAGTPTSLPYTGEGFWDDALTGTAPFESVKMLADSEAILCNQDDVPFDDHFAQITVPVLYVGAGGGIGSFGLHTLTLLGGSDHSSRVASLTADRRTDFGHVDLFTGSNAESLVWRPILDWVRAH